MALNSLFDLRGGKLGEIKKAVDDGLDTAVFYALENNRYHIVSKLGRFFLYVAGDTVSARKAADALSEYCDGEVVLIPEREDVLIPRQVPNIGAVTERLSALCKILDRKAVGAVITVDALMQLYPDPQLLNKNRIRLVKDEEYDLTKIRDKLASIGYRSADTAEEIGTFSLKGDTLDVLTSTSELPYRISFFGDSVESIKQFSNETMLSVNDLDECSIEPITDILVPRNEIEGILNKLKQRLRGLDLRASETVNAALSDFAANPSSSLNTFFIPFIRHLLSDIYKYLPYDAVIAYDDVKTVDDKLTLLSNAFNVRVKSIIENHRLLPAHKTSVLSKTEALACDFRKIGFAQAASAVSLFTPKVTVSVKCLPVPKYYLNYDELASNLRGWRDNAGRVRICVADERGREAMKNHLKEYFIGAADDGDENTPLSIDVNKISYGFSYPAEKIFLIGINDYSRLAERKKSAAQKRQAFTLPEKGDYVVHEKHGIGISEGMQKVETTDGVKDFYVVLYRDGDRLYLPADQLDSLDKYNGADKPTLHKLGGAEFARVKERVKKSIKAMAIDLLSLYQARYEKKGHVYQPDTVWQEEMESDFEFSPTDDQLVAISEIKHDMESGKIMDRLLCGDVGFGKTEVAVRAIFKTVIEHKQAVILAPTTILAQQHYDLIQKRFEKYGIKADLLCRFISPQETKEALERIRKGATSVIVATHRILSKDVKFYDLGLLVLDEEQRFGVEQKEKLKVYKNNVNILSLSATPIPRTLHMALNGIRDISTLETPPKSRMPVETYVTEYNDRLLLDAVNKEVNRGGQVFILYNHVATIEKFYQRVRDVLPPNIRIVYAHGQMPEEGLEDRIKEFYEHRADVLVSTTIIENGIDLPNANTLFVIDADALGLNQLYQLRGRVGRSNVLAYAYLTVREGKVLSETAMQRLSAIMENTELGSGFKIAMRDLEIRGAGNVLGREQHGQMEKVGYEMYLRLVKEGIDELKGKVTHEKKDIEIKIEGDWTLSEDYVSDPKARVSFYKRVSALASLDEAREYHAQLEKMYGKAPEKVLTVIRIGLLKNLAQKLDVKKLTVSPAGTGLTFYSNAVMSNLNVIDAVSKFAKYSVLVPSDPPTVVFNGASFNQKQRVKMVLEFLVEATKE